MNVAVVNFSCLVPIILIKGQFRGSYVRISYSSNCSYIVRFLNCPFLCLAMTSSSVLVHESSEPSCAPLTPGRQHNTARPQHNFTILPLLCFELLISEASYIRHYAMCFSVVYFSGPCTLMGLGAGCWWLRLLLTFTCS